MKKIYTLKDGLIEEIKGEALDRLKYFITEERITLKEVKKQYPDTYKTLMKFLKAQA